ncbi:hypothetical protein ACOMHN_016255 [Nucella lapillus]
MERTRVFHVVPSENMLYKEKCARLRTGSLRPRPMCLRHGDPQRPTEDRIPEAQANVPEARRPPEADRRQDS